MPLTQVLVLDNSNGGDGVAARAPTVIRVAEGQDDRRRRPRDHAVFHAGLHAEANGISMKDVKTATLAPQPAAQAFVAGQYDARVDLRALPVVGSARWNGAKILATTVQYRSSSTRSPSSRTTSRRTPRW